MQSAKPELRMKYEVVEPIPTYRQASDLVGKTPLLRAWKYVWAQSWAWKYLWAHWTNNHDPLHRGPAVTANMMISLGRVPRMMTRLIQKMLILTPMAAILTLMAIFMAPMFRNLMIKFMKLMTMLY